MLAADSRASSPTEHRDNSTKIHVIREKLLFKGSPLLAVGTAGNAERSRRAVDALKNNPEGFVELYKKLSDLFPERDVKRFSLLIITADHVYIFNFSYKDVKLVKITKSYAAVGSGAKAALLMMATMQAPADLSVAGAMLVDKASGGLVNRVRIVEGKVSRLKPKHYTSMNTIKIKMRECLNQ